MIYFYEQGYGVEKNLKKAEELKRLLKAEGLESLYGLHGLIQHVSERKNIITAADGEQRGQEKAVVFYRISVRIILICISGFLDYQRVSTDLLI